MELLRRIFWNTKTGQPSVTLPKGIFKDINENNLPKELKINISIPKKAKMVKPLKNGNNR